MKRLALALVFVALPIVGQETTATATAEQDPLVAASKPKAAPDVVAAARAARAKRAALPSKPKVITNADLKKAKSKLKIHELAPLPSDTAPQPAVAEKHGNEKEEAHYRDTKAAQERVAAAEKRVSDLEHELDLAEQSYYIANDPTYRDTVVRKRFEQTKRQLEDARKELADARDALAALK
jgi:hypothetical protein